MLIYSHQSKQSKLMVFSELSRLSNEDCQPISKNPHAKPEPRRLRRAKARMARLEAKNRSAAVNKNISTIKQQKKSA